MVDCFYRASDEFLKDAGLLKGATNFVSRKELAELEKLAGRAILRLPGDNARNVCEGVARLGGRATYAGCIGRDPEGRFFKRALAALHIRSLLVEKAGRTGKILVFSTPDRERTFAVDLGNSVNYEESPEELPEARYLYLTSITLLTPGKLGTTAWKMLKRKKTAVALSLESPPAIARNRKRILEALRFTDVLFANEEELKELGIPASKISRKVSVLFLKRGKRGSTIYAGGRRIQIPSYPTRVVDTTGAGDYYAAGAVFELAKGSDIRKAGETGARLAAEIIARLGASFYSERSQGKTIQRSLLRTK